MNIRQWEIWKGKPDSFEREHWFVILSGNERCDSARHTLVNGLACFSLRGQPSSTEVRLNGADGFEVATVCQCDFVYPLRKASLHSLLGAVTWERQQQLKAGLKEVFRLH